VDAPGQVAQLDDGALGLLVCPGHQRLGLLVGQPLLGEPEVHREPDQARLGAVVQVALDAAQLGRLGVHRPGAGALQDLDALGRLGLAATGGGGLHRRVDADRDGMSMPATPPWRARAILRGPASGSSAGASTITAWMPSAVPSTSIGQTGQK
jgi:hypothetical protein